MCNFVGSRSPAGSNSYLSSWLSEQAQDPVECPKGLIKAVFDNNQIIGKTYLITGDNTVPTSVMTSNIWITFEEESDMQKNKAYAPEQWMWEENRNITDQLVQNFTCPSRKFNQARDLFLKDCISAVYEQFCHGKDYVDVTLDHENIAATEKVCSLCGCEAEFSFRVCRNCKGKVEKQVIQPPPTPALPEDPYKCFKSYPPQVNSIKCKLVSRIL